LTLGNLITDNEEMQKVAYDANAIKKLSQIILKPKSTPTSSGDVEYSTRHADKLKEVKQFSIFSLPSLLSQQLLRSRFSRTIIENNSSIMV